MNYVRINLGGKERGLKFNQGADIEFRNKVGTNDNYVFYCYAMIWAGLVSNCFVKGENPDFTFEEVCDWCDEMKPEDMETVLKVYKEVHKYEENLPKSKKKLVPKSTKKTVTKLPGT